MRQGVTPGTLPATRGPGAGVLEIAQDDPAARTLALTGELDLDTTTILLERARPLLEDDGDLTVDLSDVSFVDSQGIRGFIRLSRALEGRGRLVLARPTTEVRKLFDIVGVDGFPNIVVER